MSDKELFDTLLSNVVKIVGLVMKLVAIVQANEEAEKKENFNKFIDALDRISSHL